MSKKKCSLLKIFFNLSRWEIEQIIKTQCNLIDLVDMVKTSVTEDNLQGLQYVSFQTTIYTQQLIDAIDLASYLTLFNKNGAIVTVIDAFRFTVYINKNCKKVNVLIETHYIEDTSNTQYAGLGWLRNPTSEYEGVTKISPGDFIENLRKYFNRIKIFLDSYYKEKPVECKSDCGDLCSVSTTSNSCYENSHD